MWKRISLNLRSATLLGVLSLATTPANAGRRVAPVAPLCPAEAQTKEIDSVSVEDRCVFRAPPTCNPGRKLVVDAEGKSDRCILEGDGKAGSEKPMCRPGVPLKVRTGEDVCELVEKPHCPSGFKLKPRAGEDFCMP